MVAPEDGDFVAVDSFMVFFDKDAGDAIHLVTDDPSMTDEHGQKPGLRVVFSSNPKSGNYSPNNFNRLARFLRDHGKTAPAEVPLVLAIRGL
jgi:hypothetical protein